MKNRLLINSLWGGLGFGRKGHSNFELPEISEEDRQKMIEYNKTHRCQFKRNKKKKNKLKWRKK
jgi:hypothetical protein